ncbi:MAG: hypothetical protein UT58_C0011G0027 [Microgenomates group bacterium GW2011_GWC1_39_7b]|uniref:Uncharacterized protein n=3 Tax=Candidatus Woeseibacteriota TaxID=1752722 RepID=A0A0G0LVX4_9BACT|nr:MAG: hypothetical protein UT17_C0003G0173 [Candidatus Woesebacteria bacterium GW2011_GWB1_39_10]KKR26528.1 MAG: hypothetical protein UT58_C0011G0027 [Microgenomates group bacterium GW2011_GWC1_39_7b]KKR73586.1 MAG: hypothetical protein UU16_C0018G0011 [Candidatus Woesebacteria bacterium GW2011_GWA2_40_7]KKS91110.1 MAG: hypothetical protein UV66_C0001G0467 [Candidatus Woesebacteria bacterium GW2011_GWA1_43_12]
MNIENPSQDITQNQPKSGMAGVIEKIKPTLNKIWERVPVPIKSLLVRFYSNKKIFIPVAVASGLMFLIIILGLLFGSKSTPIIIPSKKTPAPFIVTTPEASPGGDILTVIGNKLKDLNNQINALDINQNKLKPPTIDYNVSF